MNYYNALLAKKTNKVLQFGSLYERLFETWINRARQILKDLPTGAISTVNDAAELPLNALKVSVEAVQDLHGYDHPWVGGAGKNKLRLLLSRLKSLNTGGTWHNNVYTYESITYTILEDADGNITGIKVNGTTSTRSFLLLDDLSDMVDISFIMNGCPNGGASPYTASGYCLFTGGIGVPQIYDTGSGISFTVSSYGALIYLNVNNTSVSNLIFYPMLRLATETDPTFAPYSNICPISGWDSGGIGVIGKNLFNPLVNVNKWLESDGTFLNDEGSLTSQKIKTKSGQIFTLSTTSPSPALAIGFYDVNDNLLQRVAQARVKSITATAPNNTAYLYASR